MLRDVLIQKGLSNREAEVAELVTKGLSNKEVANQLFVTEKNCEISPYQHLQKDECEISRSVDRMVLATSWICGKRRAPRSAESKHHSHWKHSKRDFDTSGSIGPRCGSNWWNGSWI